MVYFTQAIVHFSPERATYNRQGWAKRCPCVHEPSPSQSREAVTENETILRFVGCGLYVRPFFFSFFFYSEKKRNKNVFEFIRARAKSAKLKWRRRCISELNGKFIVLKTKIQKLASLKQSEFFNVFLTIFSYSEIRRWIYNKVYCADVCYLLLVIVCSNGIFYPNVCEFASPLGD